MAMIMSSVKVYFSKTGVTTNQSKRQVLYIPAAKITYTDKKREGALMIDVEYDKDEVCNDILQLPDDNYNGSDFAYMINLIGESEEFHSYYFGRNIEECKIHHRKECTIEGNECKNELDDGVSWAEGNLYNPAFKGIVICHAVNSSCNDHPYSIPDLLRINSYWVDVKITCQHITDQRGRRYKDL